MNPSVSHSLPEASAALRAHSDEFLSVLQTRMREQGPLPFSEYMRAALYEPGYGYYVAGQEKFGSAGDFITAPETGSLFGRCLARQCAEILQQLDNSDAGLSCEKSVLEFGAGTGKLALVILQELQALDCLPDRYYILEPSAELQMRQKSLLDTLSPEVSNRVRWLSTLPTSVFGIILGNEVLDAMPVEQFTLRGGEVLQTFVTLEEGVCSPLLNTADDKTLEAVAHVQQSLDKELPDHYCSEVSLEITAWIASVADILDSGALLLIDYGYTRSEYYLQERRSGTLMCYYRQHAHSDPFFLPAGQDITAHVDFTLVTEAAVANGLELDGFTSQSAFLRANGLLELAQQELEADPANNPRRSVELASQVKTLSMPGAMGERFSVIAFSRNLPEALSGFLTEDFSHRL